MTIKLDPNTGMYIVPELMDQGPVPQPHNFRPSPNPQGPDTVRADLTPGEAVIPAPVAQDPQFKPAIEQMVAEGRNRNGSRPGATEVPAFMGGTSHVPAYNPGTSSVIRDGIPWEQNEEGNLRPVAPPVFGATWNKLQQRWVPPEQESQQEAPITHEGYAPPRPEVDTGPDLTGAFGGGYTRTQIQSQDRAAWDEKYGDTHWADGSIRQSADISVNRDAPGGEGFGVRNVPELEQSGEFGNIPDRSQGPSVAANEVYEQIQMGAAYGVSFDPASGKFVAGNEQFDTAQEAAAANEQATRGADQNDISLRIHEASNKGVMYDPATDGFVFGGEQFETASQAAAAKLKADEAVNEGANRDTGAKIMTAAELGASYNPANGKYVFGNNEYDTIAQVKMAKSRYETNQELMTPSNNVQDIDAANDIEGLRKIINRTDLTEREKESASVKLRGLKEAQSMPDKAWAKLKQFVSGTVDTFYGITGAAGLEDDAVTQAMVMYLGSRALGYNDEGSANFAIKHGFEANSAIKASNTATAQAAQERAIQLQDRALDREEELQDRQLDREDTAHERDLDREDAKVNFINDLKKKKVDFDYDAKLDDYQASNEQKARAEEFQYDRAESLEDNLLEVGPKLIPEASELANEAIRTGNLDLARKIMTDPRYFKPVAKSAADARADIKLWSDLMGDTQDAMSDAIAESESGKKEENRLTKDARDSVAGTNLDLLWDSALKMGIDLTDPNQLQSFKGIARRVQKEHSRLTRLHRKNDDVEVPAIAGLFNQQTMRLYGGLGPSDFVVNPSDDPAEWRNIEPSISDEVYRKTRELARSELIAKGDKKPSKEAIRNHQAGIYNLVKQNFEVIKANPEFMDKAKASEGSYNEDKTNPFTQVLLEIIGNGKIDKHERELLGG